MKVKTLLFLITIVLSVSCASNQHKHHNEIQEYSYKHYAELKEFINEKIESHKEFNEEQKTSLKNIIAKTLDKHRELKILESKTTQAIVDSMISENENIKKINQLKKQLNKVYEKKSELLFESSKKIQKIIGIKSEHHLLSLEISPFMM